MHTVPSDDDDGWRNVPGDQRQCFFDGCRERLRMCVRAQIEIGPETRNASNLFRFTAMVKAVIAIGKAHTDISVSVVGRNELGRGGHIGEPMRLLAVACPDQNIQTCRLRTPEHVEKFKRCHRFAPIKLTDPRWPPPRPQRPDRWRVAWTCPAPV